MGHKEGPLRLQFLTSYSYDTRDPFGCKVCHDDEHSEETQYTSVEGGSSILKLYLVGRLAAFVVSVFSVALPLRSWHSSHNIRGAITQCRLALRLAVSPAWHNASLTKFLHNPFYTFTDL